jgi:perosamine synthetase
MVFPTVRRTSDVLEVIPVTAPLLAGREREYVLDCLDSTWISSAGKYLDRFEAEFATFCGTQFAVTCCNGTAAVHLALLAAGIGPGDEVIVPTFTYVASVNPIVYVGATPVLVDSEAGSWNLDPEAVEAAITPRTRAILVVHLYGQPADMDRVMATARRHGLVVIEDAAEAHGATWRERVVGGIGDFGTFSFYGNKVMTTGEGGMVVCNSPEAVDRLRQFRNQGQDPNRRYWFPEVGFNYRMTNVAAAIGVAQLECIDALIAAHRRVAGWYREELESADGLSLQPRPRSGAGVDWLMCVLVDSREAGMRDAVCAHLAEGGAETRPFFYPVHTLPPYRNAATGSFPVAEDLGARGLNVPSGPGLSRDDVHTVCELLREAVSRGLAA